MKYKSLLFCFAIFVFAETANSQNRYFDKGFIVTANGDTVNGYIKKLRNSLLSLGVDFKTNLSDTITTHYKPDDLQLFYIPDENLTFQSVVFTDVDQYATTKKMFGLLLVSGKMSVYRLNYIDTNNTPTFEGENNHIYVVKYNNEYATLRMREWTEDGQYGLQKDYIKVLGKIMPECLKVRTKLEDLGFSDKEIKGIVKEYNECTSGTTTEAIEHKTKLVIKHGPVVSYFMLHNQFLGVYDKGYAIGYFVDLLNPRFHEYVSLTTGVNLLKISNGNFLNSNGKSSTIDYVTIPILATINLSNKKIAPFINAGATAFIYNYFLSFTTSFGAGTYIGNKFLCAVNFEKGNLADFTKGDFFNNYWLNFKVGYNIK